MQEDYQGVLCTKHLDHHQWTLLHADATLLYDRSERGSNPVLD